jgi:hypothetical protein
MDPIKANQFLVEANWGPLCMWGQNNDKNVHALHVEAANFGHKGEKSMQITSQQTPILLTS